jgi:NF-kappa-B inhibitor-like protein 2
MNRFTDAKHHARQYMKMSAARNDTLECERAEFTYGRILWAEAEVQDNNVELLEKANRQFEKTFDLLERVPMPSYSEDNARMKWGCLFNRSFILHTLNRSTECQELLKRSAKIAESFGFGEEMAKSFLELAKIFIRNDRIDKAISAIEKAFSGSRLRDDVRATLLITKADAFIAKFDFDDAANALKDGLKISFDKDKNRIRETMRWKLKGVLKCSKLSRKVLEMNDDESKSKCFEKIGDLLSKLKQKKVAVIYFERALDCFHGQNSAPLLFSLGITNFELGNFSKALKFFSQEIDQVFSPETAEKIIICKKKLSRPKDEIVKDIEAFAEEHQRQPSSKEGFREKLESLLEGKCDPCLEDSGDDYSDFSSSDDESSSDINLKKTRIGRVNLKRNNAGETELHRMCQADAMLHMVKKLAERYPDVNVTDESGYTPLHEAAAYGHLDYVKVLVEAGANVNHHSKNASSPLISASGYGEIDIMRYLIEKGADVTIQDPWGWTAWDHLKAYLLDNEATMREYELSEAKELMASMEKRITEKRRNFPGAFITKQKRSYYFDGGYVSSLKNGKLVFVCQETISN